MAKILTLTLNATDIRHAVKSDTYITGQVDKSADMVKNAALAFNEQAGDEQYHELKLYRTMKGALAKFEASIAEYVETSDVQAAVSDTLTQESTVFTITLTVNDRTTGAFVTTLAHLAQEFIINTMLYYWWQPIKSSLAKEYLAFSADNLIDVRRCLAKSAPASSNTSYDDISGEVTPVSLLPEYAAQTEGLFYLKGTVSAEGRSVENPIVYLQEGVVSVCDGENDLAGKLITFNEMLSKPMATSKRSDKLVTAITNAAIAAFARYNITVADAGYTDSHGSVDALNVIAYLKTA